MNVMYKTITQHGFKNLPRRVGKLMVMLPAMIAEGLFVEVLLGANKLKVVGAHLERTQLEIRATD